MRAMDYAAARHDIAIVGTGRFAAAIVFNLVGLLRSKESVIVLGRSADAVAAVTSRAADLARVAGRNCRVAGQTLDTTSTATIREGLRFLSLRMIVVCASLQSPSEKRGAPSLWTDMLAQRGFALSLPFNMVVAARILAALDELQLDAEFVNGCFPDAVNPLLAGQSERRIIGIGNIATMATFAASHPAIAGRGTPRLLAHHAHLSRPSMVEDDIRLWLDGEEWSAAGTLLGAMRRLSREYVNHVGTVSAASTLAALLQGATACDHLAGPFGLPGGYPVRIEAGAISLDLPPGLSLETVIAWNIHAGRLDGLQGIVDGHVIFSADLADAVRRQLPAFPDRLDLGSLAAVEDAVHGFHQIREGLRAVASGVPAFPAAGQIHSGSGL